jgi:DNA invertase Pin-like site-specific DNA recombinase
MTNTAIYLRQSLDRTRDAAAIDRQRTACRALAKSKKWANLREYIDNDKSASSGKPRPAYQQLLSDMAAGQVSAVVAWHLDRLHRRPIELEGFIQIADAKQIALATVSGDVDLATPQGRWFAGMMANNARYEVEQKGQRQRAAAEQMAARGLPKWRHAFGYTDDYQLHPVEAALVRKAYESILGGASVSGLAREFNERGCYGRNGKPWTATTMSLFLRAPRNAGLRAHNDVIVTDDDGNPVKGTWPPLVDEATWRQTQAVLNEPSRKPGPKSVRRHYLSGVLCCGKCADGGSIAGFQATDGRAGYRCWKCRGVSISRPDTDELIVRLVCGRLAQPDSKDLLVDHDAPDLDALSAEANVIRGRMDELATAFADGELTASQIRTATQRLRDKLDAVEAKMTDASKAHVYADLPLGTDRVQGAFQKLDTDRQRAVINALLTATIKPVGKGHGRGPFNPERIGIEWHR